MKTKEEIVQVWLPRYTGRALSEFGEYILLTNFINYVEFFSERFNVPVLGRDKPMQSATADNITIINFGMGSAMAATVMDLLAAVHPKAVLFLGKCGAIRKAKVGDFILPIAAVRGEGTSNDFMPPEVPALPSFKLHKFVSEKLIEAGLEYRTGVIYTTNRRVWEHDLAFKERLRTLRPIGIDMETATIFAVGHANEIPRGALLLVSDVPMTAEGVKTEESDKKVTQQYVDLHIEIGIKAMTEIGAKGEKIKHFQF
jgi:AMP nucleosidase